MECNERLRARFTAAGLTLRCVFAKRERERGNEEKEKERNTFVYTACGRGRAQPGKSLSTRCGHVENSAVL